jgi:predicted CoA-binding protein
MRHLTRQDVRAQQLLDRARTIAAVGPVTRRSETTVAYLRRVGYDVLVVPSGTLVDVPGPVDLVVVFGAPADLVRLLRDAAERRVDGVWFVDDAPGRDARRLARELRLTVVVDPDIVERRQELFAEAGQPRKRGTTSRRRRRATTDDSTAVASGWTEAGGGGSHGGGGGRAAIDEKKIGRPGRRGRRRGATRRRRAA